MEPDSRQDTATVTWQPPTSAGSSQLTGYSVSMGDPDEPGYVSETVPASSRSYTFDDAPEGAPATFSVAAVNVDGPSQTASVTAEVPAPEPQAISFKPPASGTVGGSAKLSATGGASGNPVVFSVGPSSGSGVCTVTGNNGSTLNYTGAGSCVGTRARAVAGATM